MKNFTFSTINNKNTGNEFYSFRKSADYSKILDSIILSNLKEANSYLDNVINHDLGMLSAENGSIILKASEYAKAANFLANYKSGDTYKLPFKFGKVYYLANNMPIVFYDDEFQIGCEVFKYTDAILKNLMPIKNTTKTIIEITVKGITVSITI